MEFVGFVGEFSHHSRARSFSDMMAVNVEIAIFLYITSDGVIRIQHADLDER